MTKDYILYHSGCMDGIGSAYAVALHLQTRNSEGSVREYKTIPVSYGCPPPKMKDPGDVYLVDFAYKEDELEQMRVSIEANGGTLLVIDHHKTNTHLEKIEYAVFDQNNSGAILTWRHFFREDPPLLLRYIEDRDLWNWDMPHSNEINVWAASFPKEMELFSRLVDDFQQDTGGELRYVGASNAFNEGQALIRQRNDVVRAFVRSSRLVWFDGFQVPMVQTPVFNSEIGHALLQKYPDAPFSVTHRESPERTRTYSLRSEDSRMDVSEICKRHGGGGHRNAAGFEKSADENRKVYGETPATN